MRRRMTVISLVVGVFVLVGCQGEDGPSEGVSFPEVTVSSIVPVPTDAPSSPSPGPGVDGLPDGVESGTVIDPLSDDSSEEERALVEALARYWAVYDKYTSDLELTGLEGEANQVATSDEAARLVDLVNQYRTEGIAVLGGAHIRSISITPDIATALEEGEAELTYCLDLRNSYGFNLETDEVFKFSERRVLERAEMTLNADGEWIAHLVWNEEQEC